MLGKGERLRVGKGERVKGMVEGGQKGGGLRLG